MLFLQATDGVIMLFLQATDDVMMFFHQTSWCYYAL